MTPREQLLTQFHEVVDFTVEYQFDIPVFVCYRLFPGGDVDNRQPSMSQTHICTGPCAAFKVTAVVWSTVLNRVRHRDQ
jgi:hypothetical protein